MARKPRRARWIVLRQPGRYAKIGYWCSLYHSPSKASRVGVSFNEETEGLHPWNGEMTRLVGRILALNQKVSLVLSEVV